MKRAMLATLLIASSVPAGAQTPTVMGVWLTPTKSAQIRLAPCADTAQGPICGTVIKVIDPKGPDGKPLVPEEMTDVHNTDPNLRQRKVLGMSLLSGFKPGSSMNSYEDGFIYNAENGKTYKATLGLQTDGTLRVRGYVGTPLLGETQIWTRIQ